MNIMNRVAKTVEDLFIHFEYKPDPSVVTSATCIAFTNLGGDDTRAVYEIYINDVPRFFAVTVLEYPEEAEIERQSINEWTEPKKITFLEKSEAESLDFYLFELVSPFGITFEPN